MQGSLLGRSTSPAARVVACILLVVAVSTAPMVKASLGTAAVLALLLVILSRPAPRLFALRALAALSVAAAVVVPLAISAELEVAGLLLLRAGLIIVVTLAFAATFGSTELAGALYALRVPSPLVMVIDTMLRQLGGVTALGQRIVLARRLRGARGPAVTGDVLAALLVLSAERAERVALGMRLRGFGERSARGHSRLGSADKPLLASALLAAVLVHAAAHL